MAQSWGLWTQPEREHQPQDLDPHTEHQRHLAKGLAQRRHSVTPTATTDSPGTILNICVDQHNLSSPSQ